MIYTVKKINKKMYIVREDGSYAYSPPYFIKIHNRAELEKLAARMSEISEIKAIIEFERNK